MHHELLLLLQRFLSTSYSDLVISVLKNTILSFLKDFTPRKRMTNVIALASLLNFEPTYQIFVEHSLKLLKYLTHLLNGVSSMMAKGETFNYGEVVFQSETVLNTFNNLATKIDFSNHIRHELRIFLQHVQPTTQILDEFFFPQLHPCFSSSIHHNEEIQHHKENYSTLLLIAQLFENLFIILTSPLCSTDANHSAGLLLAIFAKFIFNVTNNVDFIQRQLVYNFFNEWYSSTVTGEISLLNFFSPPNKEFFGKNFSALPPTAQLSILRGLIVAFEGNHAVLLTPTRAIRQYVITNNHTTTQTVKHTLFVCVVFISHSNILTF
jgi:hypothetical protein